MQLIGRQRERNELNRLELSDQAEFVAVYGRRRVGKTFLIRQHFNDNFAFYTTGLARASRTEQIHHFHVALRTSYVDLPEEDPKDWFQIFEELKKVINRSRQRKKIVFLDELPWMDTQRSEFLKAIEAFWNEWGCVQSNLLLVVCGSAASWMVKNIIQNRGGLHNRITCKLHLSPFTLKETKEYLISKGFRWENELIAECYMVMGGIPYYLHLLDRAMSFGQNIDRLFFDRDALLDGEFQSLYNSLFKKSDEYINIITALAKKKSGYTREELIKATKISNGGGLTRRLSELEQCGFIRKYSPISTREKIYQLIDFYSLFYLRFLSDRNQLEQAQWLHLQSTSVYANWCGLTFERLCFAHAEEIRRVLGISGVRTKTFSLFLPDAQMDMVIEQPDKILTLCEMKYTDGPYKMIFKEQQAIEHRAKELRTYNRKRRTVLRVLVTNQPAITNNAYTSCIDRNITIEDLLQ